jgi:general L-amino acid transport system substrate-binding protein
MRRLLGLEGDFGAQLGLDNTWSFNAIKAVGNYGEIYDEFFGPKALGLPRGLNNLWNKGGLQYALPIR